jgi:arsenical pump membrane protein
MTGAVVLFASGLIKWKNIVDGLTEHSDINPLKILVLFFSMTVLSIFLDEVGFFKYIANQVLKKTSSSQIKLFSAFYFTVSVLTIFTSNDIIILTFTPFICYFAKSAKISPIPYLVAEFVAANTASMFLIIGNPTNIYLATANGIDFIAYLEIMALPTVLAIAAAYGVMFLLFRKKLREKMTPTPKDVKIENKTFLILGIVLLSLCILMLSVSSYIDLPMWETAACSAAALIVTVLIICAVKKRKPTELLRSLIRCPWELIPFVISMFIMVLALNLHGVTAKLGGFLDHSPALSIIIYGFSSVIFCNLINNIPMSVLFSSILQSINASHSAVYATVIGSNLGAFLTPVGALAGIMWLSILKKNDINFSFLRFVYFGVIIAIPTLAAALLGLYITTLM